MVQRVRPASLVANGLWNIFTGKKKYRVTCGSCSHSFDDKVPFDSDLASSICPCCRSQNVWSHSAFERQYDAYLERTSR